MVESSGNLTETKKHVTCFLGIDASVDGSSEQAIKDYDRMFERVFKIFNNSPLGKKNGNVMRLVELYRKLAGAHGDHCKKEKKDAEELKKKKHAAVYQTIGEDAILEQSNDELVPVFLEANKKMIQAAGGQEAWDLLSEDDRSLRTSNMMEGLVIKLGEEVYNSMSEDEKRILKLFIWVGCGCHKDLNTVQGGYAELLKCYAVLGIPHPVLLPNRDNAAVIKDIASVEDAQTEAEARAFEKTDRGAIKAAQLAGAILNNKNDKRGHHDTFRFWWKDKVGTDFTFPDTSNNRFQSYCEAAAALLLHLDKFIEFLTYVKEKKDAARFSKMEENLWNALHCPVTKTEMAVLALYAQAVSHPYLKAIRSDPDINMLDLGPLHHKIASFMKRIIEDPSFLLGDNATYEMGTADGKEWHSKSVIDIINQMKPSLPHLETLLVAFFRGALVTWRIFTSEFAPGGLIDEATAEEKDLAWMPATNDVNEGALGAFRVLMRRQPQLTLLHYNALAMFDKNKTQDFIDKFFTNPDHKYTHKLARESSGEEARRKKELIAAAEKKIQLKKEKQQKRQEKTAEKAVRVSNIELIFDLSKVDGLKGKILHDQLDAFKAAKGPNTGKLNSRAKVGSIREALKQDIQEKLDGTWVPGGMPRNAGPVSDSRQNTAESGEEFDGLDDIDNEESTDDEEEGEEGQVVVTLDINDQHPDWEDL